MLYSNERTMSTPIGFFWFSSYNRPEQSTKNLPSPVRQNDKLEFAVQTRTTPLGSPFGRAVERSETERAFQRWRALSAPVCALGHLSHRERQGGAVHHFKQQFTAQLSVGGISHISYLISHISYLISRRKPCRRSLSGTVGMN